MKYASQVSQESIDKLRAMAAAEPDRFCWPHPSQGRYDAREDVDFWCYKCWGNALEVAERGSGLEKYFADQSLAFDLPEGFAPKASASLSHGGDLMAVDCINDAYTPHLFDGIRDFYLTADIPTANLESTVYAAAPFGRNQPPVPAGSTKTACNPRMNTSTGMLDRFIDSGVRYFSMANNHCYDYDEPGLIATIGELKRRGAAYSGINETPEEQDRAYIMEVNGIRIAMLSDTFDTNSRRYEKKWILNEVRFNDSDCDLSMIERQIASAREQNADLIVLHAHWGWEFELYPHVQIVELAHRLAEMGVDVIVGTHPHVSQPMEKYTYRCGGEERQCLILYSLGDFVSFHPQSPDSRLTYVVRYSAVKGEWEGQTRTVISDLAVLPVYILAEADENEDYDFRLLKFADVLSDVPDGCGRYRFGLVDWERRDLPRLRDHVWKKILMPAAGVKGSEI